jgi:hypothetical protein
LNKNKRDDSLKAAKKDEDYERDSLDSDDEQHDQKRKKIKAKGQKQDDLKMLNDVKGMGNVDWLE